MLRLTKQTDYAIVLMCRLATVDDGAVQNARDLATAAHLPLPTVSKILKVLARAGLLRSQRGAKGGYGLARPIREIIEALEGRIAITECLDPAGGCGIECSCPVKGNWERINDAVRDALGGIPLAEMTPEVSFPERPAAVPPRPHNQTENRKHAPDGAEASR